MSRGYNSLVIISRKRDLNPTPSAKKKETQAYCIPLIGKDSLLTLYSALNEGSNEAPKAKPFNTQVKEVIDTVGTGMEPSTRSQGANCLTVEGDMSWEILEISDGTADNLWFIIRDWVLS